jgi:hypothetical protein
LQCLKRMVLNMSMVLILTKGKKVLRERYLRLK